MRRFAFLLTTAAALLYAFLVLPKDTPSPAEPFDFREVHSRALQVPLENTFAWVVSLPDLISLKRQAGRPRDIEDIEALTALQTSEEDEAGYDSDKT